MPKFFSTRWNRCRAALNRRSLHPRQVPSPSGFHIPLFASPLPPAALIAALCVVGFSSAALAWVEYTVSRSEPVGATKSFKASVHLGAVDLTLSPAAAGTLFEYDYTSADSGSLSCRYAADNAGVGTLELMNSTDNTGSGRKPVRISFGTLFNGDRGESPRALRLALTDALPTDLDLSLGASKSDLALSGIHLRSLSLNFGATKSSVRFSKPNPVVMKTLEVSAGASSIEMTGLGNANFETLDFSGGATNATLDFSGDIRRKVSANISIGAGAVTLVVPKTLAVKINASDDFFSSLSLPADFQKQGDYHYSGNTGNALGLLVLDVSSGMGSVKIEWK